MRFDDNTGQWVDERDRNWTNAVRFNLPDYDVFAIDAGTLDGYAPYHAARAELLVRADRTAEARHAFERAVELSDEQAQRRHLRRRP